MRKVLPWIMAVALIGLLAVALWVAPSNAQDGGGQGASVCLQWATVTPPAPCNCGSTATATFTAVAPTATNTATATATYTAIAPTQTVAPQPTSTPGGNMTTLDVGIIDDNDDGWYGTDDNNTSVYVGNYFGTIRNAFLRFQNVTVPQGATITAAEIRIRARSKSGTTINVRYIGEDADNSANGTPSSFETRTETDTYVDSDFTALASTDFTSPSLTGIVGEIVSRPGWSSGNSMTLFIKDRGSASGSYQRFEDYSTTGYASLHIEYTSGGGGATFKQSRSLLGVGW